VRPSILGDVAGSGLFTVEKVPEGAQICEYTGTVLCTADALRLADKAYLMPLGSKVYVDAADHPSVLAPSSPEVPGAESKSIEAADTAAAEKALTLQVRPSILGDVAGSGLFTVEKVPEGAQICEYTGTVLCTADALRLADKSYLMRLGSQVYVDAADHPSVLARYINDCRNPAVYNVRFEKHPKEGKALVVASRDIAPGEELFADYGRWYWASASPKRISVGLAAKILQNAEAMAATARADGRN